MASSLSLPSFAALASNTLNADGTSIDQSFAPLNGSMFRNRLINGDMRIDQRNNGASVGGLLGYTLDRWAVRVSQTTKLTAQQNAGSVTPPTGFTNYLGLTSVSTYASLSTDFFFLTQSIEGFNFSDLAWGSANATAVTLSFRVYSSLTGTFSGSLTNSAENRSYPFTYSVGLANTWTTITVTIPGDTSGTWLATTGTGMAVKFNLGSGSTRLGTAGAWAGSTLEGVTGSLSVVGTNLATFYVTGVQFEAGSSATPFERRPIGQELLLCQRYYQRGFNGRVVGGAYSTTNVLFNLPFVVSMRVAQSPALISGASFTNAIDRTGFAAVSPTSILSPGAGAVSVNGGTINFTHAAATFTLYQPCGLLTDIIEVSAEL